MTTEINRKSNKINPVKPISSLDIAKAEELRKVLKWTNTQPLLKKFILKRVESLISTFVGNNSYEIINSSN